MGVGSISLEPALHSDTDKAGDGDRPQCGGQGAVRWYWRPKAGHHADEAVMLRL